MSQISRRKFLNISATSIALSLLPNKLNASQEKTSWKGVALGASSAMTLYHENKTYSKNILNKCIVEIHRLEKIFSLYDNNSAISILNRQGKLKKPPEELVEVLNFANNISKQSDGAFDISVQALWNIHILYSNKKNVLDKKSKKAKKLVNYKNILISKNEIKFKTKGMSITLNGIAQGYITDKITTLLKTHGFTNVLVDLGEIKAIGQHPSKRDWNISTPYLKDTPYLQINNESVASSGGYGTKFDKNSHHLFNPKNGKSANFINSISVISKSAMLSDSLSTALFVMEKEDRIKLMKFYPEVKVFIS